MLSRKYHISPHRKLSFTNAVHRNTLLPLTKTEFSASDLSRQSIGSLKPGKGRNPVLICVDLLRRVPFLMDQILQHMVGRFLAVVCPQHAAWRAQPCAVREVPAGDRFH